VWPAKKGAAAGVLYLSLGARSVDAAVLAQGAWVAGSVVSVAVDRVHGVALPLNALLETLTRLRGALEDRRALNGSVRELRVLVADTWLASTRLPWSSSLRSAVTAEAYARAQLAAAGYELTLGELIRMDDAGYGEPRLVVAYPVALMQALQALAHERGAVLCAVLPMSVAAWALPQRSGAPALGVIDEGITLVAQGGRRIAEVHVRGQGAQGESRANGLKPLWQRLRLRDAELGASARLAVLDLSGGVGRADLELLPSELPKGAPQPQVSLRLQLARLSMTRKLALDAVDARAAVSMLQGLAAGVALLVAGMALLHAWQAAGVGRAARAALSAAQLAPSAQVGKSWSREDVARVQAVNQAVRELNMPIAAVLTALRPPRDLHAAVLSVEVGAAAAETAGRSTLRIVAEAQAAVDMTRYVAFLAERKHLNGAYLTRHEIAEDAPGRPYRFTVEAVWKD